MRNTIQINNHIEELYSALKKRYTPYKARELEKVLSRTDWEDILQEYLRAKAKVNVSEANENSNSQAERCVAFLVNNEDSKVVQFFISNYRYKPAGLTTTVQLANLCKEDWKDNIEDVLNILEIARSTKNKDRKEILNNAGYKNSPLLFIEHLLQTKIGLSLFETKSKYYCGYKIKAKDVYDSEAEK